MSVEPLTETGLATISPKNVKHIVKKYSIKHFHLYIIHKPLLQYVNKYLYSCYNSEKWK